MNYPRCTRLLFILATLTPAIAGCGLELDYAPPGDASADAFGDAGVSGNDAGPQGSDAGSDTGLDASSVDASSVDANAGDAALGDATITPDVGPVECTTSADCDTLHGAPPCGAWACSAYTCGVVCASCTDLDLDGYGVGSGCAGLDCDDTDPTVTDTSVRGCYPGGGTSGVGVCHDGTETCNAGVWGACLGAQGPTPESCNGLDDDCDGAVDDGFGTIRCGIGACTTTAQVCVSGAIGACTPPLPLVAIDGCGGGDDDCDGRIDENCTNCVWVSTSGSSTPLDPRVVATPYASVQDAIDFAAMDPSLSLRVCLLSNGCTAANAVFSGPVTMASGVHVQGNYAPGGLTQCASGMHTEIRTGDATGVLFDDTIMRHTELADVMVTPSSTSTAAGITVDGAQSAVISGVWIPPQSAGITRGYGIDVGNGGDAIVQRSVIFAGRGTSEAIGVRVVDARATITNNCPVALDAAGRCPSGCSSTSVPGIRGRQDTTPSRTATSYAILLRNAPGSVVESSATCGQTSVNGAGIRIDGDASGVVVRQNFVPGWGPQSASYGIDLASCAGASPIISDNAEINAEAPVTAPAVAIRSMGDCHPIIESNLRIVSGLEGSMIAIGIECGADASGVSSRCVIERNPLVHASIAGFPTSATGVRCEQDACARIVQNEISGTQGASIVGLHLETAMTLVARNRISGGCGTASATGIVAVNSRARLENNLVFGAGSCSAGSLPAGPRFVGLAASATDATYALDVHGNDFDPIQSLASGATCVSRGVELTGHPGVFVARLAGNILLAGRCGAAYPLFEVDANSDPIALEHNDLVASSGGAVYRDEGTTDVATAALVDALGDTVLGGNVDTAPGFVGYPADLHLAAGSMCIDQDFSAGAPSDDFEGRPRTATPDIGAFER